MKQAAFQRHAGTSAGRDGVLAVITAFGFLAALTGAALAGKLPWLLPAYYSAASTLTFIAYAFDKSAARRQQRRTRECTLHIFGLIGGWPGALAAQRVLRHKTRKKSFQLMFLLVVAANCGLLSAFVLFLARNKDLAYMLRW